MLAAKVPRMIDGPIEARVELHKARLLNEIAGGEVFSAVEAVSMTCLPRTKEIRVALVEPINVPISEGVRPTEESREVSALQCTSTFDVLGSEEQWDLSMIEKFKIVVIRVMFIDFNQPDFEPDFVVEDVPDTDDTWTRAHIAGWAAVDFENLPVFWIERAEELWILDILDDEVASWRKGDDYCDGSLECNLSLPTLVVSSADVIFSVIEFTLPSNDDSSKKIGVDEMPCISIAGAILHELVKHVHGYSQHHHDVVL